MIDPDQDSPPGIAGCADALQLRAWFDALIDAPAASREAWLDAQVPHPADRVALRALLDADAAAGLLDEPADQRAARIGTLPEPDADLLIGRRFGAFRATKVIGRGGMSVVYLGERDDGPVAQRAAIKVLRRGMYSAVEQGLFRREQKALASLSHPDIAYLIDGGFTEAGLPFLVLEYVDGMPVTEHADASALGLRSRLTLFVSICRAVAAAHRQLIVHRDLKPSNILVTAEGRVKLLDFGIAKLLDDDAELPTRTGFGALTPEYAAPEQVRGEAVTTSADVYALGVVLHELLTGARPATDGATLHRPSSSRFDTQRTNQPSPAVLSGRAKPIELRGDLDNILLMALAAEPERRYRSASELGDDIERHLAGQPVLAHPPSRWYVTQKFVRRHRGSVLLTSVLLLGVFSSLGLALWQAEAARAQAQRAEREAQRAQSVRELLVGLFENETPGASAASLPDTATLLQRGVQRVQSELESTPSLKADMLITIGRVYVQLSRFGDARPLLQDAVDVARTQAEDDPLLLATALSQLGELERNTGQYADALRHFDAALAIQQERQANSLATALTLHRRALAFSETGRHEQALADYDASRRLREQLLPPGDPLLIASIGAKGTALGRAGRPEEAEPWARRALEMARAELGEGHQETARRWANLGFILLTAERFGPAEQAIETALSIQQNVYRGEHSMFASGNYNLGMVRIALGRLAAAEENFRATLNTEQIVGTADSPLASSTRRQLARIALLRGDLPTALELARSSVEGLSRRLPEGHANRVDSSLFLLRLELQTAPGSDHRTEAYALLQGIESRHPERPALRAAALYVAGLAEADAGDQDKAIAHIREAIQSSRTIRLMSEFESPLEWSLTLATLYTSQQSPEAARTVLVQSLRDADARGMATDHPARARVNARLAALR
jgi:serine/threonine protein kinase/tetratricopeptide (TPR) repeat protein